MDTCRRAARPRALGLELMSDFRRIADAALARADSLVPRWLPDGRRSGSEWSAINPTRADSSRGSFKVNVATGRWSDFATGDRGGDLISLCAYLFHGGDQLAALRDLARELGETLDGPTTPTAPADSTPDPDTSQHDRKGSPWRPLVPVPLAAPIRPVAHTFRGLPDAVWEYHAADSRLLGAVYRFRTSDGGKEVLPCVFAEHVETGERAWRWMAFPKPRPLYGLPKLAAIDADVLIVEGEKCADAAGREMPRRFVSLTWPGGGKAVSLADWSPLTGRRVIIWPDCDAQTDKTGEIKAEGEQPGVRAAAEIARILAKLGCEVWRVRIPKPGEKANGWDVADAIDEGLRGDDLVRWIESRLERECAETPARVDANTADASWRAQLILRQRDGRPDECRENVYLFLANHPALAGRVAINEFSNALVKVADLPWTSYDEEWQEIDDLRLGYWLASTNGMVVKNCSALRDGVTLAAFDHRVHPVRDWLASLVWDGVPRLNHWVEECLGADPSIYHQLTGRFFLISMATRIFRPGCKVDTLIVLESEQGGGKSSALRILAGDHFADTPFVMGDKDSFLALRGRWLYEIAELDSLNKADITRAKAFLSSPVDSYRAPYEARYENHPRQCVFAATTNQYEYLKDLTGNRRFWPIRCGAIDLEKLSEWRTQLFAEAAAAVHAGERWHPDRDEFRQHFEAEIERRLVDDPWESHIAEWADEPENAFLFGPSKGVTVAEILRSAIKMDASKIGGARVEASRVGTIMKRLGFSRKRRATGRREWVYVKEAEARTAGGSDVPI